MIYVAIIQVMAPFLESLWIPNLANDWLILRVGPYRRYIWVYPVGLIRELRVRLHSLKGKLLSLGGRIYPIRPSTILSFS
jgi:hypothetical protein